MSRPDDDSGFLGRWAKRKQEVQREAALPNNAPVAADPQNPEPADLPLPSLDDVLPGGDISAFMQKHVPDALRNIALRKAWLADPEISTFIEMADYQLDYANPDSIPGWSSKLEGVDVKAMMERVFNNVAQARDEPVESAENDPPNETFDVEKCDKSIIMNAEMQQKAPVFTPETRETDHVAVQNNSDDSDVYDSRKKRNGSALPS
jgi:Protein of unknown function (DUF3306)